MNVGLSVQPVDDEMVEEIMVQGGSVSPIVTVEPRRRKFHKAITVTMPLPEKMSAQYLRRKRETSNGNTTLSGGGSNKKDGHRCKTPIGACHENMFTVEKNRHLALERILLRLF